MLRGINGQVIFEDEEDSSKFLQTLKDYKDKCGYTIYAYCLMGNHIHLLIKEEKEELGITMRRIGSSYVYWYNWKYERSGHLFQDRYKSEVVEDEKYLLAVIRYIHQNPLKAGLVRDISDYRWSSYSDYIEGGKEIVDFEFILNLFGSDIEKAKGDFKTFHEKSSNDNCLDIEESKRLKDEEAILIIKRICKVSHSKDVQILEKEQRAGYIKTLKNEGLSTRQIARLTGISRTIVLKA
ncbi:MAG: transposase [Peptococcaceae bacterium]|nr:transposase [Peptococcaceae bacterium]